MNKTSTWIFLSLTVILHLGHTLNQPKIVEMKQDVKAIAIEYQIIYRAVLKPFIAATNQDTKSSTTKNFPQDNLPKFELEALPNLQKRNEIITTKVDKGGAVVILDIKDYIVEAYRQLNDTNNYKQLNFEPTELHT